MNNKRIGLIVLTTIIVFFVLAAMPVSALYQWEQVSEEGFGDLSNDYAWSMHDYKGYLYVGTLNTNSSNPPNRTTDGLEIWRSPSRDAGSWTQVVGPTGPQFMVLPVIGVVPATAGFNSGCIGARGMEVSDGLLWIGTSNPFTGCQIWVTNGTQWKRANIPGFGNNSMFGNPNNIATRGITVYKGAVYAEAQNPHEGAGVWKYTGPTDFDSIGTSINQGKWIQVNVPGFGEPATNLGIGELIPYDPPTDGNDIEYLYAGTWNGTGPQLIQGISTGDLSALVGCQVWRTDGTVDPVYSPRLIWEKVMDGGFGDPQNGVILSSAVFNDKLYMGTQNFHDLAELWRTSDGTNWEPITTAGFMDIDDFDFRGFGNGYMWRMIVYNESLFVGTLNPILGCQVWRSPSGESGTFEQVNVNGMNGERTIQITSINGFPITGIDQYGVRSFAEFKNNLYLGTASWGDWVDRMLYPGTGGKWHNLSGYVGCEIWRTDGTPCILSEAVDVNKTVWDPVAQKWVSYMVAPLGDTVRFRCEIWNIDSNNPITNIVVWDFLSHSLEYADNATRDPTCNVEYALGTLLKWDLSDISPGGSIVIEYDANVIENEHKDVNFMFARGLCNGYWDNDWDYAVISPTLIPTVASSNATGVETDSFDLSEDVYCYAENLPANRTVDIYVVKDDDPWAEGAALNDVSSDKKETVKTQPDRSISNTRIWKFPLTPGDYDIVIDTNQNGKWNEGEPIDSWATTGFEAVPEFTTIAIPVAAILGLLFFFNRRKQRKE